MQKTWAAAILTMAPLLVANDQIEYEISFPNAVHHEAEIAITFSRLPAQTLELRMSRSSPGRYAIHEFGKNVYEFSARDAGGQPLAISRPNPYQWNIAGHDGFVRVSYTLFADRADGTYSAIDETHAHLNIPATFMWARGLEDRPITVKINIPANENWEIATQLQQTQSPNIFRAPNLSYFLDSPIEAGDLSMREWQVSSNGRTQTIRLALHHDGTEAEVDAYARMAQAIVLEQEGIFGKLPSYDYGTYTFIIDYLGHVAGDGMEHRNSTVITSRRPLATHAVRNAGMVAHEFFHCWNVERLRPQSLEPFDFERANMSAELWFAEGVTSYYTGLTLARAGLISLDAYAKRLSTTLDQVLNAPGRRYFSPVEMSMQAPFVDAATSIDPVNRANTYISYYSYGSVVGLGLDLMLRSEFENVTLDDLMRAMWQRYGKTEIPYRNDVLQTTLAEISRPEFARTFFDQYIFGHELVDYQALLARAGLLLRQAKPDAAWLGDTPLRFDEEGAVLRKGTIQGTPLYQAGLDRGARLLELDGVTIDSEATYEKIIAKHRPGDLIPITFEQRGRTKTTTITFAENPALEVVPFEHVAQAVTDEIADFRTAWLGSKAQKPLPELRKYCPVCRRAFRFDFEYCHYDGSELGITAPQTEAAQ